MPLLGTTGSVAATAYGFGSFNPVPVLTFGAGTFTTVDNSTITFSSLGIGAANTFRRVIVCCAFRLDVSTNPAYPTVTVGGASTTRISQWISNTTTSSVARVGVALYITTGYFATGTTANIVVTRSGTLITRCFASTYSIVKNGTLVVVDNQAGSANPTNYTSTKTAAQVGVAVAGAGTLSTLTSFSLTGAVTSNYNSGVQESGGLATGVAGTGTITYTSVGTSSTMYALLVVWR